MPRLELRRSVLAVTGVLALTAILLAGWMVMPAVATSQASEDSVTADVMVPQVFFLNLQGQVVAANPDGANMRILVDDLDTWPDGIAVDVDNGYIYWSNMGAAKEEDGSVIRSDLYGGNVTTIVPSGGTFTAKQLTLDTENQVLYWSDREGMRVQRANVDGTGLETLVQIAEGEEARLVPSNWAVGVAVDFEGGHVYWTQKGGDNEGVGSIRRAGIDIPEGQTAANRQDIEILFADLPEPIDLALDLTTREIYWTDRGDPPVGNTVNRAPMDPPAGVDPAKRGDSEILVSNLNEAIGISLDLDRGNMYFTDLRGSLYSSRLDGSEFRTLGTGLGTLTGIAFAEVPLMVTE
jgi:DNA-binding beta-propeller fold protein YncE